MTENEKPPVLERLGWALRELSTVANETLALVDEVQKQGLAGVLAWLEDKVGDQTHLFDWVDGEKDAVVCSVGIGDADDENNITVYLVPEQEENTSFRVRVTDEGQTVALAYDYGCREADIEAAASVLRLFDVSMTKKGIIEHPRTCVPEAATMTAEYHALACATFFGAAYGHKMCRVGGKDDD
jgi:hypothetical protein